MGVIWTGTVTEPDPDAFPTARQTSTFPQPDGEGEIWIVRFAVPFAPLASVAVTTTAKDPLAVGVPEMVPVVVPMVNPAGSPVADQV